MRGVRAHRWLAVLVVLGCGAPAAAQPGAHRSGAARPIAELPARVVAADKAVTLFADYQSVAGGQIQLYLVNRSAHAMTLPTQDGVLYIKLEAAVPKQGWARAQRHVYSSCGNSYDGMVLKPGHFVRVPHWFPTGGTRTSVRYRLEGATGVVSNVGAGWFQPAEAERARLDAMAMKTADVATLREVLLTRRAGTTTRDWERQSAREAAIRRVESLPRAEAIPLADELVMSPWLDANEYSHAIRVANKVAPDRLAAHVIAMLAARPGALRTRLVHELPFMPTLTDPALVSVLLQRARQPTSADVPFILDYIAEYRTNDVAALLRAVQRDKRYPRETRIRARYDHEQWFGDKRLDVRISPIGGYSDGHKRPVAMDVTIINASSAPISFAYDRPTDLLSFYLTRANGREQTFLPPRAAVRWFTGTGSGATRVTLAPGKSHVLRIALEDYFDLGAPAGGGLSVWVSVKLPGQQAVARLGGGGSGINPR
jgi:hypothetical protein